MLPGIPQGSFIARTKGKYKKNWSRSKQKQNTGRGLFKNLLSIVSQLNSVIR